MCTSACCFRLVEDEERTWTDENVDVVALKHFPNINQEEALGRQILYSNWFSKDYVPVKRDELRNYVKARLKVSHVVLCGIILISSLLH